MKKHEQMIGKQFQYDRKNYPLDSMVLKAARVSLAKTGKSIETLSELHQAVDQVSVDPLYADLYAFFRTDEFMSVYRSYIREVIRPLVGEEFYYQRVVGVRIHIPRTLTVQYHTDEWYGHGRGVVNFWTPLTHAYSTNSLYVASLDESIALVQKLERDRATMKEINDQCQQVCRPLDIEVGLTYCFNSRIIHGTERNLTDHTRVSLDYRILLEGGDPGSKPLNEYYEHTLRNLNVMAAQKSDGNRQHIATSYIFPKHGFTRYVSAHEQRLLNQDFANRNQIDLVAEETEIKTMSHHPMLLSLAGGWGTHKVNSVVAYSVMCLPEKTEDRSHIFQSARSAGTTLFFANEGLTFPKQCDEQNIEAVRHRRCDPTRST